MYILRKCNKCGWAYLYDPKREQRLEETCKDCFEKEKVDQQDFLNDYNNEMFWEQQKGR